MISRGTTFSVLVLVAVCVLAVGSASATTITFKVEGEVYSVRGCTTFTDGDMLVPATAIRNLLEGGLTWNEELQAVIFHSAPTQLTFFHDKNRVLMNGEETFLTHRAMLRGGKMYLPLGFICAMTGVEMQRVSPTGVILNLDQFGPITAPSQRKPLEVMVGGVRYLPETYRCLPTSDQLRVATKEVAEMFGGEATWDSELRAAILTVDSHRVIFFEDKATAMLDGLPFELSRKPVMSKVKMLVPLDSLCEMLGRQLDQVGANQFVVGEPNQ